MAKLMITYGDHKGRGRVRTTVEYGDGSGGRLEAYGGSKREAKVNLEEIIEERNNEIRYQIYEAFTGKEQIEAEIRRRILWKNGAGERNCLQSDDYRIGRRNHCRNGEYSGFCNQGMVCRSCLVKISDKVTENSAQKYEYTRIEVKPGYWRKSSCII